ncbi:MAG: hypothetical protein BRC43_15310 [Cyanobacteria bacterium QS_3_48_167]|nr:MAG: hypothetical protein BRC43_15310 [Cyanobacteria bacterium QS_3_48_167]
MPLPVDDSSFKIFQGNNLSRNQEIDKLLLEKISLAAIARVASVSEKCLQDYVKAHYAEHPRKRSSSQKKGKIIFQCDEAWSFLGNKDNQQWIWLALDVNTKQIVGEHQRCTRRVRSNRMMELPSRNLPTRRCLLHGFLGSLCQSSLQCFSGSLVLLSLLLQDYPPII